MPEELNRRAQPEPAEPAVDAAMKRALMKSVKFIDAAPSVAPEPVAWMWRNTRTGAKGVYFEDPERFFNIAAKGEYEWTPLFAHPPRAPLQDEHPYTYTSTQATNCAGCGEYKHTPLRIDAMGGYVCLACIDKKLGQLLGEFGYPAPQAPLTCTEALEVWAACADAGSIASTNAAVAIVRETERRHGIGAAAIGEKP